MATASDGLVDVSTLVGFFEASEDATNHAREEAQRDRDYVDNIQLTAEELEAYRKRRQPPIIVNRIKRKVDFLKGYEQAQRVQPRVLPRTPAHEEDAEGCEQALRYVADAQRFSHKRSRVWDNILVEGMGGYRIGVKQNAKGEIDVEVDVIPWDRMFYDPHSSAPDFSDAGYLGVVKWMDLDEAIAQYPEGQEALEWTLDNLHTSDTYDDKPKFTVWADKKRKRVRICQIWVKKLNEWHYAEFTKGGILKAGRSPYQTDGGESDCELVFGSAYVNRDNERYGLVREMIGPQDEINKRRSKALHLLNTNQVVAEEGAVRDVEKARREMARPDGWVTISPGYTDKVKIETRLDLATGHLQLLQEAKNEIDLMAGNIGLQGGQTQTKEAASGKAIMASQQSAMMEVAPLMDALRDMDLRVFRAVWNRVRQFWKEQKWIRVTDDEKNVKWLGLNVDPLEVQMLAMNNPQQAQKIAGTVGSVAEMDVDINIEEAPDGISSQMEQFQSLVQLKQFDANGEIPMKALISAMPNLRNKEQILQQMEAGQQPSNPQQAMLQQTQMQMELQNAQFKIEEQAARAEKTAAEAQKVKVETALLPQKMMADIYAPIHAQQAQTHDNERQRQHEYEMGERSHANEAEGSERDRMHDMANRERDRQTQFEQSERDKEFARENSQRDQEHDARMAQQQAQMRQPAR
jgi:hypothetical protein